MTDLVASRLPLLVASDIDGTLLDSRDRVSPRLRGAISRMLRRGVPLALATGRPARWLEPVLEQLPVRPMCVCANGAIIYDSDRDEIVMARELSAEVLADVVKRASEATASVGGIGVAVERAGASAHDAQEELFVVTPSYDHAWEPLDHGVVETAVAVSQPATKLLLRNSALTSEQLYNIVAPAVDEHVAHVTYSISDGLLEVAAPGVNKSAGLHYLAELVGATPSDVVCFGDMPNDIEMLNWAGLGVAMGNAADPVMRAADEVTATNNEDGVARVLERWF